MIRRLVSLLLTAVLFSACSSLGLVYGQLPRLTGWWADSYLDLDRVQKRQLDAALAALHTWHRREELPHWLALLEQASSGLSSGVTAEELQTLEAGVNASLQRTLERAAPLARPLLARLRPEQWDHLRQHLRKKLADAREEAESRDAEDRAKAYIKSLERWLGDLPPAAERLARQQALAWPAPGEADWSERAERQSLAYEGLRAWAAGDADGGVQRLMAALGRDPAQRGPMARAQHQRAIDGLLRVLPTLSPPTVRQHWLRWQTDLLTLSRKG